MNKIHKGLCAGLLASVFAFGALPAQAETYIVAVGAASNSLQGRSAQKFAEVLKIRLKTKIWVCGTQP